MQRLLSSLRAVPPLVRIGAVVSVAVLVALVAFDARVQEAARSVASTPPRTRYFTFLSRGANFAAVLTKSLFALEHHPRAAAQ